MKVTVPTSQSRRLLGPQRAMNPYSRHPRAPTPSNQHSPQPWNGTRPGMPPAGFNPAMMGPGGRAPHMVGSPRAPTPDYMNGGDIKPNMVGHPLSQDLSAQRVPNENLTPDQLKHRESGLASLQKIHEMLLADGDAGLQTPTDYSYSHINMAQDRQAAGPYYPPSNHPTFPNYRGTPPMGGPPAPMGAPPGPMSGPIGPMGGPMGAPHGAMYGPGHPMSPSGNPMMESKPPPPYPMPSPGAPPPQPAPKKAGRKRKGSTVQSSAPTSPLDQPPVKSERHPIPPSPLAAQPSHTGPTHTGGPRTPQPKQEEMPAGIPGPMRGMMQQQPLSRQQSLPQGQAYRMMQAGRPTPYQVRSKFNDP